YLVVPHHTERVLGPVTQEESAAATVRVGPERRAGATGGGLGIGWRGTRHPAKIGEPAKGRTALGRFGRARQADADSERGRGFFHRGNCRSAGFKCEHREGTTVSSTSTGSQAGCGARETSEGGISAKR